MENVQNQMKWTSRVIRYAHERLDPRHASEKPFDELPFHELIAGEIELATRKDIADEERTARLSIAKTLCYHKAYLEDEILREGYDQMMKRVERRTQEWDEVLGEHLHEFLNYKANVIMREKLQNNRESQKNTPFTKVENKKQMRNKDKQDKVTEVQEKLIYCNDYNNGNCIHRDHHEGRFAGKKCTRFHICRKCYTQANEVRSHCEDSDECPKKFA